MKILSFGHIPIWAGGRQTSGLANVIYQLAKNMSDIDVVEMYLAATDVYSEIKNDEKLTIIGWCRKSLFIYILLHPFFSLYYFIYILYYKFKCGPIISVFGHFLKGVFLKKAYSKVSPEMVHLHGVLSYLYLPVIPRRTKIVVTIHGMVGCDREILYFNYYRILEKKICETENITYLSFIANKLVDDFRKEYGCIIPEVKVILNAYDSTVFYKKDLKEHKTITLCTVASVQPRKGQERVLNALMELHSDMKYICIGNADEKQINLLKESATSCNINFEYLGLKKPNEIREIYSSVDYMILPSSSEGFGLVFLEAIACGVPVILPKDLPIVKENGIIQSEVNAILLQNHSVDSIKNVLINLNQYKFDRNKVAESIQQFSWKNIARQYVDIFIKYES